MPGLPRYSPPPLTNGTAVSEAPCAVFSLCQRGALALGGAMLIGLLGIAGLLRPDPRGYGTHQGLGLPPCTVVALYGVRCPACGMTTSWSYLVRGRIWSACRANSGGTILGLLALTSGPWMLISGVRGRWWIGIPSEALVVSIGIAVVAVTLGDWIVRLRA